MAITIDQFTAYIKERVEKRGRKLGPRDDWAPIIYTSGRRGNNAHAVGSLMRDEIGKQTLAAIVIPRIMKEDEAELAALLTTAWSSGIKFDRKISDLDAAMASEVFKEKMKRYGPQASNHPDRVEIVNVVIVTPEHDVVLNGIIKRREHRSPEIEEWHTMDGDNLGVGGRFGDALHRGLMSVAAKNN